MPEQEQPPQAVPISVVQQDTLITNGEESNPVGNLQEICMRKKWPPPDYNVIRESGLPHDRLFSVKISLGKYQEIGKKILLSTKPSG